MEDILLVISSTVLGVALAASCGLRAFLPLFVVGLIARFTDLVDLGDAFEWLSSGPALLALGVGVMCELVADKVPVIDNLLNAIQTPVRTLAGMLIYASVAVNLPPWMIALLAIIVGGGVALTVHVAKSMVRLGSSTSTGGAATPVMSIFEDIGCLLTTVLSVVVWLFALVIAAAALFAFYVSAREVFRRANRTSEA